MMIKKLISCHCLDKAHGWVLMVLRVIVGVVFLAHGYQKIGYGSGQVANFFGSVNIPMPLFFAYVITYLELVGGAMLILGLLTHLLSKLFAIEMIIAFLTVHMSKGIFVSDGGFEFVAVIFGAVLVLMAFGPGKLALDDWLKKQSFFS